MGNRSYAIKILEEKGEVVIKAQGKSMQPKIMDGSSIFLKKVDSSQLRVGDAVFVKVKSSLVVHEIGAINGDQFKIQNHKGFVNGWVSKNAIYGLCVATNDKIFLTKEDLDSRLKIKSVIMLIIKDDLVLGITRGNNKTQFELIGGEVKPEEDVQEAAVRITKEKVNIAVKKCQNLFVENYKKYRIHYFLAEEWDGEPCNSKGDNIDWIRVSDLTNEKISKGN